MKIKKVGKHSGDEWKGASRSKEEANFYHTEQIDDKSLIGKQTNFMQIIRKLSNLNKKYPNSYDNHALEQSVFVAIRID